MWEAWTTPAWEQDRAFAEALWEWGVWLRWPVALILVLLLIGAAFMARSRVKRSQQLYWILMMERLMRITGLIIVGPSFWLLCQSWKALKDDDYLGAARLFAAFIVAHERDCFLDFDILATLGLRATTPPSALSWVLSMVSRFL